MVCVPFLMGSFIGVSFGYFCWDLLLGLILFSFHICLICFFVGVSLDRVSYLPHLLGFLLVIYAGICC